MVTVAFWSAPMRRRSDSICICRLVSSAAFSPSALATDRSPVACHDVWATAV